MAGTRAAAGGEGNSRARSAADDHRRQHGRRMGYRRSDRLAINARFLAAASRALRRIDDLRALELDDAPTTTAVAGLHTSRISTARAGAELTAPGRRVRRRRGTRRLLPSAGSDVRHLQHLARRTGCRRAQNDDAQPASRCRTRRGPAARAKRIDPRADRSDAAAEGSPGMRPHARVIAWLRPSDDSGSGTEKSSRMREMSSRVVMTCGVTSEPGRPGQAGTRRRARDHATPTPALGSSARRGSRVARARSSWWPTVASSPATSMRE